MKRIVPMEDSRRVVAVTLALWALGVAAAGSEGVFAKLAPATFTWLATFAVAFALASYALDRGVRVLAAQARLTSLAGMALAADLVLVATAIALARNGAPALESLARFPFVMSALFVAPLAAVLNMAALGRATIKARVRRAPARSPGANPAAT
jgi:hypothetical protein